MTLTDTRETTTASKQLEIVPIRGEPHPDTRLFAVYPGAIHREWVKMSSAYDANPFKSVAYMRTRSFCFRVICKFVL